MVHCPTSRQPHGPRSTCRTIRYAIESIVLPFRLPDLESSYGLPCPSKTDSVRKDLIQYDFLPSDKEPEVLSAGSLFFPFPFAWFRLHAHDYIMTDCQ